SGARPRSREPAGRVVKWVAFQGQIAPAKHAETPAAEIGINAEFGNRVSERNLVVHVVALETLRYLHAAAAARAGAAATAFAARIQHLQFAAEILQHHLGRGPFLAVLVGELAGLQLALQIDLGAFAQILLRHF